MSDNIQQYMAFVKLQSCISQMKQVRKELEELKAGADIFYELLPYSTLTRERKLMLAAIKAHDGMVAAKTTLGVNDEEDSEAQQILIKQLANVEERLIPILN